MRYIIVGAVLLLTGLNVATAAAPDTLWTRVIGGVLDDWVNYVEETSDHGYVIAGSTRSDIYPYNADIVLVKLNHDGSLAWSYTYGTDSTDDVAESVKELADGSLVVFGYGGRYYGTESRNFYMMKLTSAGTLSWDGNYDWEGQTDYGFDGCRIADGGFILVGRTYYYSVVQEGSDWGPTIFKVDSLGNQLNEFLIDKKGTQSLDRVVPTLDGGAIAIGTAGKIFVAKITAQGDTAWTRGYGGTGEGAAILQLDDGTYAAFGVRGYNPPENDDFWLLRIGSTGDTLWTRRYRNAGDNNAYGMDRTSDGGYVMVGNAYRNGTDPADVYIVRVNSTGDTLWTKMVGGDLAEAGHWIKQTADGGYIIAGRTESFAAGENDFYIIKLAPDNVTDVESDGEVVPVSSNLGANYPNPFNPSTTIEYSLERRSHIVLDVFNVLGQRVRTLLDANRAAGSYKVLWDGRDDRGQACATGVYMYRLQADGNVKTRKMLLLK